jgi:hypothetical protein
MRISPAREARKVPLLDLREDEWREKNWSEGSMHLTAR